MSDLLRDHFWACWWLVFIAEWMLCVAVIEGASALVEMRYRRLNLDGRTECAVTGLARQ